MSNELTVMPAQNAPTFLSVPLPNIEALKVQERLEAPRKMYWFGTLPGSPWQNTACGGLGFNRFEDRPKIGADGNKTKLAKYGEVKALTDDQAKAAIAGIMTRVFRKTGDADRGEKVTYRLTQKDALYIPERGDEPFAEHCYFVEIPKVLSEGWREQLPLSVAESTRRHFAAMAEAEKKAGQVGQKDAKDVKKAG